MQFKGIEFEAIYNELYLQFVQSKGIYDFTISVKIYDKGYFFEQTIRSPMLKWEQITEIQRKICDVIYGRKDHCEHPFHVLDEDFQGNKLFYYLFCEINPNSQVNEYNPKPDYQAEWAEIKSKIDFIEIKVKKPWFFFF